VLQYALLCVAICCSVHQSVLQCALICVAVCINPFSTPIWSKKNGQIFHVYVNLNCLHILTQLSTHCNTLQHRVVHAPTQVGQTFHVHVILNCLHNATHMSAHCNTLQHRVVHTATQIGQPFHVHINLNCLHKQIIKNKTISLTLPASTPSPRISCCSVH